MTADGKVRVLVSSTEFGQGTNTVLTQIAAETLGLEYQRCDDGAAGYQHRAEQRTDSGFSHGNGDRDV